MSAADMFRTVVDVPSLQPRVALGEGLVFLGSCFAENMGCRFQENSLPALVNPLGVLYNPQSISNVVSQALTPRPLPLFAAGEEWRCWLSDTLLGGATEESCRQVVEGAFLMLGDALRTAGHLFITLGTNVSYRLRCGGLTVSNCHRQPSTLFEECRLSQVECVHVLNEMFNALWAFNPGLHIVLTVSPYRYAKYGYHQSQLSKSTLLLAVDELCALHPGRVNYFPAYEIVMDELRDYRFYGQDMLHPSLVAVDYIWNRLVETALEPSLQSYLRDYASIRVARQHRPSRPGSPQHEAFLEKIRRKEADVMKKYNLNPKNV